MISIEKKYDVRSTFFVRVNVIRSDKDYSVLRGLQIMVGKLLCILLT